MAAQNSSILVAEVEGCVGLATVHLRGAPATPIFIQQTHAVIDDPIVLPNWRRRGIASELYQACANWAIERNARWLEVNVYNFNSEAEQLCGGWVRTDDAPDEKAA